MSDHDMWTRLPQLDEREIALRLESNSCAFPSVDDDGQVKIVVSDRARLDAIKQEMASIVQEREIINRKLEQLKELLGRNDENCVPGIGSDPEYIARLKADLGNKFFHKVLSNNRVWLTPEEALADPRYLAYKAEILPSIEAAEARITKNNELAAAAYAILNGL
jgi:hypothetical protein